MKVTPEQIEDLLPQTQCTLCGYSGCRPYAEAMLYKGESIDKCLPGGVETLLKLGKLLEQDAEPFIEEMEKKAKPDLLAVLDEAACIGCKKCIQVCPVDAILGAPKQMHSIINDECTGCELCVPACPVDCIQMVEITPIASPEEKKKKAEKAKSRYEFRQIRLHRDTMEAAEKHRQLKFANIQAQEEKVLARKLEIQAAVARMKEKKGGC